jgi:cullin-4
MSADPGALKRKHPGKTIKELFTTQSKPHAAAAPLSPTTKRPRRESSPAARPDVATPPGLASTMSTADMYHFASRRADTAGRAVVVDITSSPDNSPARPHGQRTGAPNMHASGGPKRLLVKNFKPLRKVDPKAFLDQTWQKIDRALDTIFARGAIDFSLEELYRGVENVCRQGMARDVKERLVAKCRAYVGGSLQASVADSLGRGDVEVLRATLCAWAVWNEQVKYLDWVFCYLDRAYLLPRHESLRDISVDLFRVSIFAHAKLNPRIVDGACHLVATDRVGADLDSAMFSKTVSMFHDMHVYTKHFEPRLLELSQEYVMQWADDEAEKPLAEYIKRASALMDREMSRVAKFGLPNTTKRDLLTLLEDHLISRKESRLTNQDELADLLETNAIEDIELLYSLLERRKLGTSLRPGFVKWIDDEGTALVFNEKEQESMVTHLLTLKRQLDRVWKVSFHRNTELGHGLRESFEAFMNKTKKTNASWGTDNSKTGEMIAKYVDMLLRGGAKAIPASLSRQIEKPAAADAEEDNEEAIFDEDTEVNNQLDQVLDLFRFVHGKAVFEAFYKKDLARRLLMGRSASADAERSMLSRLKTGMYSFEHRSVPYSDTMQNAVPASRLI